MKNFFIGYNKADRDWAVWIDRQLRDAGYTTTIQVTDMPPGSAFVHEMDKAVEGNEGLIAVLSPDYLNSPYCESEWQAFYQKDPNGEKRALIPVRVRECQPKGLLAQRVYIDLVGKDGAEARRILLDGVKAAREKLELPPRHPVDYLLSGYLEQLRRKVSTVRIFGDDDPHELDQVFIELTLNEEYDHRPSQADFLGLMDAELRRMRSVVGDADQYRDREGADDFADRGFAKTKRTIKPDELLRRYRHAVVTGAPGCGKTTLLRYLAWQTLKEFGVPPSDDSIQSQNKPLEGGTPNYRLPIFLELKQLTPVDFQPAQGQLEHLLFNKAIGTAIKPSEAEYGALKDRFLAMLREGRVAIFLDGLDEVSGASFFQDLQRAITDFLHSVYGANILIISTRPFALRKFGDAKMMEIQPLNPRQIEQFIEYYYRDVPERQQFRRKLQRSLELRELARVPALLGFILQLWRKRGNVTDDKLELYEQITLLLAEHRDTDKEGVQPNRKWQVDDKGGLLKRDFLRQLAFNQMFQGIAERPYDLEHKIDDRDRFAFNSDTLISEAEEFAIALYRRTGKTLDHYALTDDVKASALLREVGDDYYAFAHLTLQEYLAAWQLARRHDATTCERIFCRAYFNPALAEMEVLPMTLGLVSEPDKLYEALEQLPESMDFKGLRLQARGLGYSVRVGRPHLNKLSNWLIEFITQHCIDGFGYRETVLRAFSSMIGEGAKVITKGVITLLHDERDSVRGSAASALGQIGNPLAVPALQKVLSDVSGDVRGSAVSALGKIGAQETVASLINLLNDSDHFVQGLAVDALKQIGDEQAMTAISKREAENIADEQDDDVEETYEEDWDADSFWEDSEEEIDEAQIIQEWVSDLSANDIIVREVSAESLVKYGGKGAVPALVVLLENIDANFDVRRLAAETLGRIGGKQARKALIKALADYDIDVRIGAIEGLGYIRSKKAIFDLSAALLDDNSVIRMHAIRSLAMIGGVEVVPFLIESMEDEAEFVYHEAVRCLECVSPATVVDGLLYALSSPLPIAPLIAVDVIGYYKSTPQLLGKLSEMARNDCETVLSKAAQVSFSKYQRKLQYFDIPIPTTPIDNHSLPGLPPPLTAQELMGLETQIATKYQEMLRCSDARQKGKALEELLAAIFASIPGFTVSERNYHTATEEIDLVVRNASADPFWRGRGNLILVEAKHWRAQRVGKNEYVQFYRKMENRGGHCTLGFLICSERFAETFEKEMLRDSKFPLRVVPIDGEELQRLVESQDRSEILRGFVERALLT